MIGEGPGVPLRPQVAEQLRRPFDVGEKKGDGSGREIAPRRRHVSASLGPEPGLRPTQSGDSDGAPREPPGAEQHLAGDRDHSDHDHDPGDGSVRGHRFCGALVCRARARPRLQAYPPRSPLSTLSYNSIGRWLVSILRMELASSYTLPSARNMESLSSSSVTK